MRRAEWRSLPEDSATVLVKGWRAVRPRPRRLPRIRFQVWGVSWRRTILLLLISLGLAFDALLLTAIPAFGSVFLAVFALPLLAATVWGAACWLWGGGSLPPKLLALASDPSPGESFPVRVTLRRWGKPLIDDALLTFVDGWLHVEGLRTTFSLRACDVGELTERRDALTLGLPDDQRADFRLLGGHDEKAKRAFREALRIWRHYAIESPEGESRLPPL